MTTGARFGKSEVAAIALLIIAMLNPGEKSVAANTSITQDQAEIVWGKCEEFVLESPHFIHWASDIVRNPFPKITLSHGAEIWARSTQYDCKYLRGHSFVALNYDEIAYGSLNDLEVLRMRLADKGGKFTGTTTPRGKNWYWRECWRPGQAEQKNARAEKRKPSIYLLTGRSYDNPWINREYVDTVRLTERQRQQEVDGLFLDTEDAPFKADTIEAVTNADLNDKLKSTMASKDKRNGRFVSAWDLAKKADWTVGGVFDVSRKPWELVWFDRFQKRPWPEIERAIKENQARFDSDVILDTTGIGESTWDHLDVPTWRLNRFDFTNKSKTELITNLQYCIEKKMLTMPFIKQLQDELYNYEWDDKDITQDCVMMLGLLCWRANQEKPAATMY